VSTKPKTFELQQLVS